MMISPFSEPGLKRVGAGGRPRAEAVADARHARLRHRRAESARSAAHIGVHIERDPADLRGTGGVLADLARQYEPDELLLVANGAQIPQVTLTQVIDSLAETGADVAVIASGDGYPGEVMLIRCGALHDVATVGFHDFKEQLLPTLAERHRVAVARWGQPVALPIRTLAQYMASLKQHHRVRSGTPPASCGVDSLRSCRAVRT